MPKVVRTYFTHDGAQMSQTAFNMTLRRKDTVFFSFWYLFSLTCFDWPPHFLHWRPEQGSHEYCTPQTKYSKKADE